MILLRKGGGVQSVWSLLLTANTVLRSFRASMKNKMTRTIVSCGPKSKPFFFGRAVRENNPSNNMRVV